LKKKHIIEFPLLFVLGGLTSLSLPPLNFFIINFFTFSIFFGFLFKSLNKTGKKFFFFYGWFFGFGYFLTNLYWITISLTFDENLNFLIPIALILIPSLLALFYGLATFFLYLFNPKNILSAFFGFSVLFGIIEFLRGTILTGFPWNLIVYSFSKNLSLISILSFIGTYSLNLIVISFFSAPTIYIFRKSKKEILVCIFLLFLPILFLIYGNLQKEQFTSKELKKIPYTIRIIGSNISLNRFYDSTQTEDVVNELISLSSPVLNKKIFFLWPEGIIPDTYQKEIYLYNDIFSQHFDENHLIGLGITNKEIKNGEYKFYNSFSIFDNKLNLVENYDKNNLVPFGEFLPFENFLKNIGLKTITNNFGSFSKGNERKIIEIKKNSFNELKFLPLICYEIIYSGNLASDYDFDFIMNISEDGWFGKSIGPKQHFAHSIFRAIESGKYLFRSANNGISAIINPLGEVEQQIDFVNSGYIDFEKKRDLNRTVFSTYGNIIFIILILLYIFLAFSFNKIRNE
jgi:apolipoprotein N-acyltransferase